MKASRRQHDERGFAIVIVVLVTGVALLSFLFATATMTIASRTSVGKERASTQALLAADSGLRTLLVRATDAPYVSGTFESWIAATSTLNSLDLGDGISASIVVLDEDLFGDDPWVLVEATGVVTGGSGSQIGRRVLVQRFAVEPGLPVPLSVNVPAALTSVGSIISSSNAVEVVGADNTEASWTVANVDLCQAKAGEYVRLPPGLTGDLYQVVDADDADPEAACGSRSFTLRQAGTVGDVPGFPGTSKVDHRPFAITETLEVDDGKSLVQVTDAARTLFAVGTSITIGASADDPSADSVGEVVEVIIDPDSGVASLSIEWSVPPENQTEGAVVRRGVKAGLTQGKCPYDNKGNLAPAFEDYGCDEGANLSGLFFKTFGRTIDDVLVDEDTNFVADGAIGSTELSGWNWYTPSNANQNVKGQFGEGILIIDARGLTSQGLSLNVDNNFTGLIYVLGDADINGNAEYVGAIVIEGTASVKKNDGTSVGGTGGIYYDLLATSRALANLTRPSDEPGSLGQAIAGTWRIR